MTKFIIADRPIGKEHPPLVIAEIGINHEGQMDKAIALVDAAVRAGAEVVKFQCHIIDDEMIPHDIKPPHVDEPLRNIIDRCSLSAAQERELQDYTEAKGAIYLSTPFSRAAADRLHAMGVPAFKIGSGECNNLPLLKHIAAMGKPIILSTGMNDIASITRSVETLRQFPIPLAIMHCTSLYPTPHAKVNLGAIQQLQNLFPDVLLGLSDHSVGIWTALGGVALGACIIEKHFTLSRAWPGPDMALSIEPQELTDLISGSTAIWQACQGDKIVHEEEKGVMDFAYASIVTLQEIKQGEILTTNNIWVKRPGIGDFLAKDFEGMLGKVASEDIPAHVLLERKHIDE